MKSIFLLLLLSSNYTFSQTKLADSLFKEKKNVIYWMPTSIGGDLFWEFDNYWIEMGFSRQINNSNLLDLSVGEIVHSSKSKQGLFDEIDGIKSKGTKINLEHKLIFKKNFYYSTNLYYQQTSTIREEQFWTDSEQITNQYTVKRNVFGLVPKIGYMFVSSWKIYTDIGIGAGISYISSHSYGKIDEFGNLGKESFANKIFDTGSKFAQRIVLQFKIGYNF